MPLRSRLLLLLAIEVAYFALTRLILARFPQFSVGAELLRTLLRFITCAAEAGLFRSLLLQPRSPSRSFVTPPLLIGVLLFLVTPVLVGQMGLRTPIAVFFAVTSLVVGLKEEILFRGVLQGLLHQKFGAVRAVALSTVLFVVYHVGSVPWNPFGYFVIVFASVLLGCIYARTGSLALVVALHAAFDAISALGPLPRGTVPLGWAYASLSLAVAAVGWWASGRSLARAPVGAQSAT